MPRLPHCDDLFRRFFDRWYDGSDRERKGFKFTRPDTLTSEAFQGSTPSTICVLTEEFQTEVAKRIEVITRAASSDWGRNLALSGNMDLEWVRTVDNHYDKAQVSQLIKASDPEDFANDYLVTCCEFGAMLGYVMKQLQPRLFWKLEWPYWESSLIDPVSGTMVPVFHWAIKKMSDYGWDDGFAEKIQMCLGIMDQSGKDQ